MPIKYLSLPILSLLLTACTVAPSDPRPEDDFGLRWVKTAAEYDALTRQAYATATRALPEFVHDKTWSALPGQTDADDLPPAVILDVDETVVSNVDFQLVFERPFENWKLEKWTSETPAMPIQGVLEFVEAARAMGVTVLFVTNRPCEIIEGNNHPCPQKLTTIDDIAEVGIETDTDHVFLSEERGWNREKLTRRNYLAQKYRILMLIGDDLGDFIPCSRSSLYAPCTTKATQASRKASIAHYSKYWGNGWYILPNPMHGSWTSAD